MLVSPLSRTSLTMHGWLVEPVAKMHLAQLRVIARNERALAEFGPEVPRVRVDDNIARVLARAKTLTDQLVETELFRAGHFHRAVHRRTDGDPRHCLRDVIRG